MSDHVLCSNCIIILHSLRLKAKVLTLTFQVLLHPTPLCLHLLLFAFPFILLQTPWPSCCSLNMANMLLSPGFCPYSSLYLEQSAFRYMQASLSSSNVTKSLPSWLDKLVHLYVLGVGMVCAFKYLFQIEKIPFYEFHSYKDTLLLLILMLMEVWNMNRDTVIPKPCNQSLNNLKFVDC